MSEVNAAIEIVRSVYSKFAQKYLDISETEADEKFRNFVALKWKSDESDGDKELEEFYKYVGDPSSKVAEQFLTKVVEIVISYAVQARRAENRDLAWSYAVSAVYWAASIQALDYGDFVSAKSATLMARSGATAKLASDPKQTEKAFVRECWQAWQSAPNPKAVYSGKAAFARDMLSKCEHLTSQKRIEDWCREWGGYANQ